MLRCRSLVLDRVDYSRLRPAGEFLRICTESARGLAQGCECRKWVVLSYYLPVLSLSASQFHVQRVYIPPCSILNSTPNDFTMASTLSRCSRARLSSLHTHRMLGFGLGVSQRRHIAARATAILQEVDDEVLLQPLLPSTSNIPGKEVPSTSQRVEQLKKHAKPFSEFLTDGFGRQHTYLRISVTERCNLRCSHPPPHFSRRAGFC